MICLSDINNSMSRQDQGWKNDLQPGRVLQLNGYNDDRYVIIRKISSPSKYSWGATYETISLDTGDRCRHGAETMRHISEKKDNRIQMYITDDTLSPDEIMDAVDCARRRDVEKIQEKQQAEAAEKRSR